MLNKEWQQWPGRHYFFRDATLMFGSSFHGLLGTNVSIIVPVLLFSIFEYVVFASAQSSFHNLLNLIFSTNSGRHFSKFGPTYWLRPSFLHRCGVFGAQGRAIQGLFLQGEGSRRPKGTIIFLYFVNLQQIY
jgi:hypothetical protein